MRAPSSRKRQRRGATIRSACLATCLCALAAPLMSATPSQAAEPGPLAQAPIKIAIFEFELEDFSAGGPIAGESAAETARLQLVTREAKRLLAKSGRYALVETSAADTEAMRAHWLRNCNGCEADIAASLGAEQSLLGIVQKLSVLVHTLRFEIKDAKTGRVVWNIQTDLRGDTDESWLRSVKFLMHERLLASGGD